MKRELTTSQFSMWRSIVALTHIDGLVHQGEAAHLTEVFAKLPLNDEQRKVLADDVKNPKNIDPLFEQITTPADRSQFIYFARLLFWSDGDFAAQEREVLKHLGDKVMGKVNLELALSQSNQLIAEASHQGISLRERILAFIERFFD